MQVVSNDFRPTLYSGGAIHQATLTIGNTTIGNENIKNIKLSNPIIDKTSETFYIGTFVSKQLEVEFYNVQELDLTGQVHLSIGTYISNGYILTEDTTFEEEKIYYVYEDNEYVEYDGDTTGNPSSLGLYEEDGDYETLDIGYFNIETSPEDYYKNAKIVALDNAIKFKPNVDYSEAMGEIPYEILGETSQTTYTGKNLFNTNTIVKGRIDSGNIGYGNGTSDLVLNNTSFSFTTVANYRGVATALIPVNSNTTYYYSETSSAVVGHYVDFYDTNGDWLSRSSSIAGTSANNFSFTTPINSVYVRISYQLTSSGSVTIEKSQLEKGSAKTSYEPYVGGIPAPNPDYPQPIINKTGTITETIQGEDYTFNLGNIELCKIGNYQDKIYKNNGTWYLHKETDKVILPVANMNNGDNYPGWQNVTSISGVSLNTYFSNQNTLLKNITDYLVTIFEANSNININTNGSGSTLWIPRSAVDKTQTQWKQAYPDLVVEIVFGIPTPTDTEITDTTLLNQLESVFKTPMITCENLLIWLCNHFEVSLGTYPTVNKDIAISTYDSSISGKQYISYIAEIMGGNAQIGRDGHLYIIPLKQTPAVQIDATESKSWELGDKYEISGVSFFDALRSATIESGTDTYNILNIRSDNPFLVGDNDNVEEIVENIYDEVEGTIIYNVTCENYADYSLDSWDFITYLVYKYFETEDTTYQTNKNYYTIISGEYELLIAGTDYEVGDDIENIVYERTQETYNTINDNEYTYSMTIMGKVDVTIPNKAVENTTNIVGDNENTKFNILRAAINHEENRIDLIAGQSDGLQSQINTLSVEQEGLYNSYVRNGGANLFYNTGLHFTDENGNFTYWQTNLVYSYVITTDTTYQEYKEYYSLVNDSYVLLVAGTDYEIGDTISGNVYEQVKDSYLGVVDDSESLSGTNMVLPRGKTSQTIQTKPDTYSYSFSYRQNVATSLNAYATIGGTTINFEPESDWNKVEGTIITGSTYYITADTTYLANKQYYSLVNNKYILLVAGTDYQVGSNISGTVYERTQPTENITIEFDCDVQGGYYIKELMLVRGDEPMDYSQNINESRTDTVKISDGIEVSSTATKTISRMDNDGFRIFNKNEDIVLRATENGTETRSIIAEQDSEVAGLLIKKYQGHVLMSGKGDE